MTPEEIELREYFEALLREQEKAVKAALSSQERVSALRDENIRAAHDAAQRAVDKAEDAMTSRLDLLNEFRAQQADESRKYVTRETMEIRQEEALRMIEKLDEKSQTHLSREVYSERHIELIRRLDEIDTWRANMTGRWVGLSAIGAIGIAVTAAFVSHLSF